MKFLVDAQLPRFLNDAGHDTVHTSELPDGNRTTDGRIAELADGDGRVVVTKDRDFRDGTSAYPTAAWTCQTARWCGSRHAGTTYRSCFSRHQP